jgi:hypothetical protein
MNLKRRHTDRDPFATVCLLASFFMLLFVFIQGAKADEWFDPDDLIVELGTGFTFPLEGDVEEVQHFQFRGGYKNFYLTYEAVDEWKHYTLGQQNMETDVNQYGVGFRYPVDTFEVYIEGGMADLNSKYYEPSGSEVAYTYLVGRHAVGDRRIPVPCAYNSDCYSSEWNIESESPFATVGIAWAPIDHFKVQASYTYLQPEYDVNIKRPDYEAGQGYWRETGRVDMGSFKVTVLVFW